MEKEVYDYLRRIGLIDSEIDFIEDNNDHIVYLTLNQVKKIINILKSFLSNNELKEILIKEPKILYVNSEYLREKINSYQKKEQKLQTIKSIIEEIY